MMRDSSSRGIIWGSKKQGAQSAIKVPLCPRRIVGSWGFQHPCVAACSSIDGGINFMYYHCYEEMRGAKHQQLRWSRNNKVANKMDDYTWG